MRFLRTMRIFFKYCEPSTLQLLWSLMQLPGFLFHEVMHLIFISYFDVFGTVTNFKITEWYLYRFQKNDGPGVSLRTYSLAISFSATSFEGVVVSIAPLIGYLILMTTLALTGHWFVFTYCLITIKIFYLSAVDIESLKLNGLNLKTCQVLSKIQQSLKA